VERAELDELRAEVERIRRQNEELRGERTKLTSQIHELQNQNAQLIEDHTRDVLSIKAKETQLVRARSDFEASEQTVQNQRREVDRLKRELSRQVRVSSPPPTDLADQIYDDDITVTKNSGQLGDSGYGSRGMHARRERSFASGPTSPGGDGKENFDSLSRPGSNLSGKLSPRADASGKSSISSRGGGRISPAENGATARGVGQAASGAESWKRAAEVTQNLKQRIEMMKVIISRSNVRIITTNTACRPNRALDGHSNKLSQLTALYSSINHRDTHILSPRSTDHVLHFL
jgi:cytoskeleton-associated protein 5